MHLLRYSNGCSDISATRLEEDLGGIYSSSSLHVDGVDNLFGRSCSEASSLLNYWRGQIQLKILGQSQSVPF